MRGRIVGFDPASNTGAIAGDDGRRYDFVRLEWRGSGQPGHGEAVDFVPEGERASRIYPLFEGYDPIEGATANTIYILYLVSLLVGITAIIGVVMAYVNRGDAPEWVRTHYRFQIRTFWIGLLYAAISAITVVVVIGALFGLFAVVWWIVRCAKGMKQISRGLPCEKPATWLW